jgi:hypothetical protein
LFFTNSRQFFHQAISVDIVMATIANDDKVFFDVLAAIFVCLQVVEFEDPRVILPPL